MIKINLLKSLPKSKRKVKSRFSKKTEKKIKISRKYDFDYFDGSRDYGYGGYYYDGRWVSVAKDIIKFFKLKKNDKILDVGCAKGFLLYDLFNQGMDVYGLDVSKYAKNKSIIPIKKKINIGDAKNLPYPDNFFDAAVSINTIHNLEKNDCINAIKELNRVVKNKKKIYIQVDSYTNKLQKKIFEEWVLTAKFHDFTYNWIKLFKECNYKGSYNWTIIK